MENIAKRTKRRKNFGCANVEVLLKENVFSYKKVDEFAENETAIHAEQLVKIQNDEVVRRNQDCRRVQSSFESRLHAYFVPIKNKIASIIGPPDIIVLMIEVGFEHTRSMSNILNCPQCGCRADVALNLNDNFDF